MYTIGFDLGSSSVKVALVNSNTGKMVHLVQEPAIEMPISSKQPQYAEQDPVMWWANACKASKRLLAEAAIDLKQITAIGISYQMHGLVLLDKNGAVLRDAIIWCDSRAVTLGETALNQLGKDFCTANLYNSPGNFTASKLAWVKENEPEIYAKTACFMLPGDFLAYKLCGEMTTTKNGLSEGILWNFKTQHVAKAVLNYYHIDYNLIPTLVDNFCPQGKLSQNAAVQCGLPTGIPLCYRAGDQPNNALSLNVLNEGEVALSAGTSGVIYALSTCSSPTEISKINHFVHVNYRPEKPIIGTLLNINGVGAQYRWLRDICGESSYEQMHEQAVSIPVGSDGVVVLPFGNGAERMFNNRVIGTHLLHLNVNSHRTAHLIRATLEGIAFAFAYGLEILEQQALPLHTFRAGNDNLFQAQIFGETLATIIQRDIEIYHTTGAVGAAIAAGLKGGNIDDHHYSSAFAANYSHTITPHKNNTDYLKAYAAWKDDLNLFLTALHHA